MNHPSLRPRPVPVGGRVLQWLVRILVVGYFCVGVAAHWRAADGFASLVRFGENFTATRLHELDGRTITTYPKAGYDGQFYAQLAIRPDVTDGELQHALDNPRYRSRRILLPLVAHVLGGTGPWAAVQVYAMLNVAAWLALAWLVHLWTAERGLLGTLQWAAVLTCLGALESVQLALTDLPATVLIAGAVGLVGAGRRASAVLMLALAGLARETSALAVLPLLPERDASAGLWWRGLLRSALAVLPVAGWLLFLNLRVPAGDNAVHGNFDWPGVAIVRHLGLCIEAIAGGAPHLRHFFAPLAILGMGYQSVYLLRRALKDDSLWVRAGLPFAVLFWFLGDWVWAGYWAVARACLPMSMAFFLCLPRDRHLVWRLVLTSLCLPHALFRFWPEF